MQNRYAQMNANSHKLTDGLRHVATDQCMKCHGTGKFVSNRGRVIGPCFQCKGTGKVSRVTAAKREGKANAFNAKVDKTEQQFPEAYKILRNGEQWVFNKSMFLSSVREKFFQYGSVTPNQAKAVVDAYTKLSHKVDYTKGKPPEAEERLEGSLAPMLVMFQFAAKHIKKPKIGVRVSTGELLRIKQAHGERWKGWFAITEYHGTIGNGWVAMLSPEGDWVPNRRHADQSFVQRAKQTVEQFLVDPVQAATAYGNQIGHCCFCSKELTDERSKAVGYGPVCASHFHLPWGE